MRTSTHSNATGGASASVAEVQHSTMGVLPVADIVCVEPVAANKGPIPSILAVIKLLTWSGRTLLEREITDDCQSFDNLAKLIVRIQYIFIPRKYLRYSHD